MVFSSGILSLSQYVPTTVDLKILTNLDEAYTIESTPYVSKNGELKHCVFEATVYPPAGDAPLEWTSEFSFELPFIYEGLYDWWKESQYFTEGYFQSFVGFATVHKVLYNGERFGIYATGSQATVTSIAKTVKPQLQRQDGLVFREPSDLLANAGTLRVRIKTTREVLDLSSYNLEPQDEATIRDNWTYPYIVAVEVYYRGA